MFQVGVESQEETVTPKMVVMGAPHHYEDCGGKKVIEYVICQKK